MYLVILAFDNLNFRQWAVRYKAIRHIFLSLREDPPIKKASNPLAPGSGGAKNVSNVPT